MNGSDRWGGVSGRGLLSWTSNVFLDTLVLRYFVNDLSFDSGTGLQSHGRRRHSECIGQEV